MGDLLTLGWVILKAKIWYLGDKEMADWHLNITTITDCMSDWNTIHTTPTTEDSYHPSGTLKE